ncbi:MAG: hypothetical protein NTV70_21080 [Acidobacteria bacterium]|nr:hypothetical protein [Acidobacteriota bacterium]
MTKTLLLVSLCCAAAAKDKLPTGLTPGEWANVRSTHERHRHAAQADGPGVLKAQNVNQQWTTRFDSQGFLVKPEAGRWSWGLSLASYGFSGHERSVSQKGALSNDLNRIRLDRGALEEWWLNDTRGLEHGFTLPQRPSGSPEAADGSPLRFTMAVRGTLTARLNPDGQSASFVDSEGTSVMNYAGLKVWDRDGRVLPSRMEAADGTLALVVDEQSAHYPITIDPVAQQAYIKASNTDVNDRFGFKVAISGDTMVVTAYGEASTATGVNGNQTINTASNAGAAYVFVRNGGTWTQQAYLKASNAEGGDYFGYSVSISGDTIVIGAPPESGAATGINGNAADNSLYGAGAAYVFVRTGTTWTQQAYLKAPVTGSVYYFGYSVYVSGDTVVVGSPGESSNATGVNGNPNNTSASSSGAAYVFVRSGTTWTQQAYLKASNSRSGGYFGLPVAIDGDTIVVGSQNESSNATGVNGNQADTSASGSGAAYVFVRSGTTWTQQAYLKASNTRSSALFGYSVSVSGDTVAIGSRSETSNATGVNGNQANTSASGAGAAYVFVRSGTTWTQQAYVKASNTFASDAFGEDVAVSGDFLAVGAIGEDSNATGVDGLQTTRTSSNSGAVYLYLRSGTTWSQLNYLKASNSRSSANFGYPAISGSTLVVGAPGDSSNATGVGGDQTNTSASFSGAAYVFELVAPNPVGPLELSPAMVSMTCVSGRSAPSANLWVNQGGYTLVPQMPWLTLAQSRVFSAGSFTLRLANCALPAGQYSSMLSFNSNSTEAGTVLVQLTVVNPPELFSTPGRLDFSREVGAPEPLAQKLWIVARNLNVGYTLASASPWLEIVNVGNQTPQQIEVRLKQPPTEVGVYQAEIVVTSSEVVTPLRIPVTYTVSPVTPKVSGGVFDFLTLTNGTVGRGSLATVYGQNLADRRNLISSTPYPMVLDGVVVKVNGTPCPTLYTDPGQLAFQIPSDITTGTAKLVVERNGVASEEVPFVVQ